MGSYGLRLLMFQSRNRETYDSNLNGTMVILLSYCKFQSRNRETYDSNYQDALREEFNTLTCFNLVIEKLMIPTLCLRHQRLLLIQVSIS